MLQCVPVSFAVCNVLETIEYHILMIEYNALIKCSKCGEPKNELLEKKRCYTNIVCGGYTALVWGNIKDME